MMKSIARSQHMEYVDASETKQNEMGDIQIYLDYQLIFITVERKDGMGLVASNAYLSAYDVSIGFYEDWREMSPKDAHRFADRVIGELKRRWHVHIVRTNQDALPLKSCPGPRRIIEPGIELTP